MFPLTDIPTDRRPLIEMRIRAEGITPATTSEVTEALDGMVTAETILVLLRGLATEDTDTELIRSGNERLADVLEDYDPSQRDRVASIGMLAGHGAPWHLRMSLRALDAADHGWAMQHLDTSYRTYTHPAAMVP